MRRYKDFLAVRAPIVEFLNQNKNLLDKLGEILGSTRKEETRLQGRVYTPKVLSLETVIPSAESGPGQDG